MRKWLGLLLPVFMAAMFFRPSAAQANEAQRLFAPVSMRTDDAVDRAETGLVKGSHIRVFLPSLPYIYISHSINAALLRPANNEKGWKFDLAVDYVKIDETTYEFRLRDGVAFQDGSPFNADAVLLNMQYFKREPFLFTQIHEVFDYAEKIDDHTVRFHLKQPYGQLINDLIWIQFYTREYLEKHGWNGKATCPNLAEPGPFGLGPYILTDGYIEGDRQTPKAELVANPRYWDKRYPKIERVTVYSEKDTETALAETLYEEGRLDWMPIPFERKVETILSPYAKVTAAPSTNNWAIHMNLRNGHPRLLEKEVRLALNQALHQENLLKFVYDDEGIVSPTLASPLFPGVERAVRTLPAYSEAADPYDRKRHAELKSILNGLTLKVFTQERFLFLWRGIEYQLKKVGVTLNYDVTRSEKDIFAQLLTTNAGKNTKNWDLLIWGDDDWYYNHPWSAFLVYRTHNYWSTIFPDPVLDGYIDQLFQTAVDAAAFPALVSEIMNHVYDNAYMLFVPTPNAVLAVNKELVYHPYKMAILPLWEMAVTPLHPSIREGDYPEARKTPVRIVRYRVNDKGFIVLQTP